MALHAVLVCQGRIILRCSLTDRGKHKQEQDERTPRFFYELQLLPLKE